MGDKRLQCDICDTEVAWADRWVVRVPRPSNPREWTAILWLCPACGADNGARTESEWDDWIEGPEGRKVGALWLT